MQQLSSWTEQDTGNRSISLQLFASFCAVGMLLPTAALFLSWKVVDVELWRHVATTTLVEVCWNTAALIAIVAVAATTLGAVIGWLSVIYQLPRWLLVALVLPLAMPKYILGFCYLSLLDYAGPLQSALRKVDVDVSSYLQTGQLLPVSFVFTLALYPYVFLLVRNSLLNLDRNLIDAARSFGASDWRAAVAIAFPLVKLAIVAGFTIVALECLSDFGAVAIFNFDTFTTLIYKSWFGLQSFEFAAQLSTVIFVVVLLVLLGKDRHGTKVDQTVVLEQERTQPAPKKILFALGLLIVFSLVLPLYQIIKLTRESEMIPRDLLAASIDTMLIAALTALMVCLLTLPIALSLHQSRTKFLRVLLRASGIGYGIPGVVLAVGILTIFELIPIPTNLSLFLVGVSLAIKFSLLGTASFRSRVAQIPDVLRDSARSFGANRKQVLWHIEGPLILKTIVVVAFIVFLEAAKEMPITLMTRGFGVNTLASRIFEYTSEGQFEYAAYPSLILVGLSLFSAIVLLCLNRST